MERDLGAPGKKASSDEQNESGRELRSTVMNKRVIASVVLAIVILSVGYYGFSGYEQGVVQTSVVTGMVTGVQSTGGTIGPGVAQQNGNLANIAAAQAGGGGEYGLSYLTISVGSESFTQTLRCGVSPYYGGETVQVADQLLRNGQHRYFPDTACSGAVSPFQSLHLSQTNSSSTQT